MHYCKKILIHFLCHMTSYLLASLTFIIGILEIWLSDERKKKIILTFFIIVISLLEIINIIGIKCFNIFGLKKMISQYKLISYLNNIDEELKNSSINFNNSDRAFINEVASKYDKIKNFIKGIEEISAERIRNTEDIYNNNNFNSNRKKKKRKRRN